MSGRERIQFLRELTAYVLGGRRFWLAPLVVVLLVVTVLAATGALAPWAVFVYPL